MTTPLTIVLRGEDDLGPTLGKVKEELGGVGKAADDAKSHGTGFFGGMMQVAGGMLASNVIGGLASQVGGFFSGSLSAAKEANLGFAQTEAVIKSTGGAAGFTAQQVSDMAGALSAAAGKSMFGDDDILKGQNLLLTFTNIKTTLPETSKVMVDMATAMHTDVAGGAIQLGKALNDPIAGISALSRVGVTFDAQQKAQIKTMQDAGNMAGAQGVILKELNKEFGGSAAAAIAADGGMTQFKDRMGEMQETIGKAVLPVLGKLMGVLNDTLLPIFENAAAGVGPLIDQISSFGGAIGDLIHAVSLGDDGFTQWGTAVDTLTGIIGGPAAQAVAQFVGYAFDLVGAIQAQQGPLTDLQGIWQAYLGYVTTVASAIQGVVMAAFGIISGFLEEHGAKIQSDLTGAWTQIQAIIQEALPPIQSIVTSIFGAIQTFLEAHGAEIQAFLGQTWDAIAAIIQVALALIQATIIPILTAVAGFIAAHSTEIQTVLSATWTIISTIISTSLAIIQGVITAVLQAVQGNWSGAWETIKATLQTVWTAMGTVVNAALTAMQAALSMAWDAIKDKVMAAWEGIKAALSSAMQSMVGSASAQASAIGEGIIHGIGGALSAGVGFIRDIIVSIVHQAVESAKHALGISSPSTVFADEVGTPIIQGVVQGIQSQLPNLVATVANMGPSLLAEMKKIATLANTAMAGIFSSQADLAKQQAQNLEQLTQLASGGFQVGEVQAQLESALAAAKAKYQNPQDQAKYYQMESQYILDIAAKQKALNETTDAAKRERLTQEIALTQEAQAADEKAFTETMKNGNQQLNQLKAEIDSLDTQAQALYDKAAKEKGGQKQTDLAAAQALSDARAGLQAQYEQLVAAMGPGPLGDLPPGYITPAGSTSAYTSSGTGGAQTNTYRGTSGGGVAQTSGMGAPTSTGTQNVTVNLGGVSVDQRGALGSIDDKTLQKKLEAMFHDLMQKAVSSALKEAGASSDRRIRTRAT